jgi:glycosyltransferase involved in cell wall biosynthesis
MRDGHDAFMFNSQWQRGQYLARFQIPPERTIVVRNAVAPVFQGLFAAGESIRGAKTVPPVLAYTSTPFRGLELLVEMFPTIRKAVPQVRLEVYSSMKVYQMPEGEDEQSFGRIYRVCRETEGIDYVGSLPQPELARRLRSVTALVYPNIFPETLCLAVLEAMAAGCGVITSDLAALPETTAGFARLIPITTPRDVYKQNFCDAVVDFLQRSAAQNASQDVEKMLQAQVCYVNERCTWARKAQQWETWLTEQLRKKRS